MRLGPYVLAATALLYPAAAGAALPETSAPLGGPKPACRAEGTRLRISAEGSKFDKACLAAPADRPFTIVFENRDTIDHNVAILGHHGSEGVMFRGKLFAGPETVTYEVGALPAGIYHFHCEAHQTDMMGIFAVDAPDGMQRPMAGMAPDMDAMGRMAEAAPPAGSDTKAAPMASDMGAPAPMPAASMATTTAGESPAEMGTLARTGPSRFRPLLVLAGLAFALGGLTVMGSARRTARRGSPAGR